MARYAVILFFCLLVIFIILPAMIMWEKTVMTGDSLFLAKYFEKEEKHESEQKSAPGPDKGIIPDLGNYGPVLKVYNHKKNTVTEMTLEKYLVGVVAAEMPSSFSFEALKAQAVAARTYAIKKYRAFGGQGCNNGPSPADICTDYRHCQAWTATEDKEKYEIYYRAVSETIGEIITDGDDEIINAVYHSTCGGETEEAGALWAGSGHSYLQSIQCNHCRHSPHYRTTNTVTWEEIARMAGADLAVPVLTGGEPLINIEKLTPGNRVSALKLGEKTFTGPDIRTGFNLPSASFTLNFQEEHVIFHNKGFGHGVGLCQYGADGLAREGYTYDRIIRHYYSGVEIKKQENPNNP